MVNPFELETMAMLERTLNYAHTGSARVLTRTLMDRAWLSISVVKDGLPCISNTFIQPGSLASGMVSIRQDTWPVHPGTQMPLTSSQRSQELTYGKPHYAVRQSHSSRSHITDHGHNAGCVLLFVYRIMDMGVNVGCGTFVDRLSQSYLASFTINLAMKYMPISGTMESIELNPVHRVATYAAVVAMKSLVNDVKTLVKTCVLSELTPIIEEGGLELAAAVSRRNALFRWFKSDNPLSMDQDAHPSLIEAVAPPVNGVMELTPTCPSSVSVSKFVEDVLAHCTALNPRRKPPFIADGQFLHVTRATIRELTTFGTRHGLAHDSIRQTIQEAFVSACHTVKINHVPWSTPRIVGRRGAPSSQVVHNVWLSLGAKNPKGPPVSAVIRAHNNTPAAIAQRSSQKTIAEDGRGEWSALNVSLKSFHTVLHKVIPPREISEGSPDTGSNEAYILEGYTYARDIFDMSKPLHLLALVASIACAGLLPNVWPSKDQLRDKPSCPSQYRAFIRTLDWEFRESRARGVTDTQIFVKMVTGYIICMYDEESPIMTRSRSKEKGIGIKKWMVKHSRWLGLHWETNQLNFSLTGAKGITSLLLCRLGIAKIMTHRAFASAQWHIDISPLSKAEINVLYDNVISRLKKDPKYGGYDAVQYMMGTKIADILAKSGFVHRRPTPETIENNKSGGSNLKRTQREWEQEEEEKIVYVNADVAGIQVQKRKVSRAY